MVNGFPHDFPYKKSRRKCPHKAIVNVTTAGYCDFGCVYCYANFYKARHPRVYSNIITQIRKFVSKVRVVPPFYLSAVTDPLQRNPKVRRVTMSVVKELINLGLSFHIVTKGDASFILPLVRDYPWFFLQVTIEAPPGKERVLSRAPGFYKRLAVVRKFANAGIDVVVRIDPRIIGFVTDEEFEWMVEQAHEAGAYHIVSSLGTFRGPSYMWLLNTLENNGYGDEALAVKKNYFPGIAQGKGYVVPYAQRAKIHTWQRQIVEKYGLTYGVCLELPRSFDSRNTVSCDNGRRNPAMIKKNRKFVPLDCYMNCLECSNASCPTPRLKETYPYRLSSLI